MVSFISTASNTESILLRLPQELKNQIYELVFGGQLIHLHRDNGKKNFAHHCCQASASEKEAYELFVASEGPWSSTDVMNRHHPCHDERKVFRHCRQCYSHSDHPVNGPRSRLNLALTSCCRQIHQETCPLILSTNTWSFSDTPTLWFFCHYPGLMFKKTFWIRRLHLHIEISDVFNEPPWNQAFDDITLTLKSLQYLYIHINLQSFGKCALEKWRSKEPPQTTLLKRLLRLRNLRLRVATVIVSDASFGHVGMKELTLEEEKHYRWTTRQKQEWAAYVTRVLLRQEDREDMPPERGSDP